MVRGTVTDVKPEILERSVIVGGELFTDYSITLANLSRLNPKETQINRRRTLPASFPLVGCLPQAAEEDFSPKSQDAVALQQIKERGALPMIDRGDIRQAIDRCSNIWASLPEALVMVSSSIRLTAELRNSKKRAERSES